MGGSAVCKVTVLDKFIWSVFGTQRLREQVSRRAQRETLPRGSVYPRPLWLSVELWRKACQWRQGRSPCGEEAAPSCSWPGGLPTALASGVERVFFFFFFVKYSWPRPWSWLLVQLFFLVNLC